MTPDQEQPLIDHLSELRKCLIRTVIFVAIGFLGCWFYSDQIFDLLRQPISPFLKTDSGGLIFTAPMDKFMAHIKVALFAGFVVSSPLWMHQLWLFISPALYKEERKYGVAFILFGTILFLTGVSFVYFVVYPLAFEFLMTFGGDKDVPLIKIDEYLSFITTTTLVFGLTFEMPLILAVLGRLGVVSSDMLKASRRYTVVILALISAIVTPPDLISQILLLIPLYLLFEFSIYLVKAIEKKQNLHDQ